METNQDELSLTEQAELTLSQKIDKYNNEIMDFFDFDKPLPSIFKNGEFLREDYRKRSQAIIKRDNCADCELNYFKAHYIEILADNIVE